MTTILAPGEGAHAVDLGGAPVEVFTWRPNDAPELVLVVFHGMHADADVYRDRARPLADRLGAVVVAPRFGPPRFTVPFYQRGGVAPDGTFIEPGNRTVDLVAPLIAWAQAACARPDLPHALIGHSAGGQFLSRVAAFAPTRATRYVIANPSTWVLPGTHDAVPYGFGGTPDAEGLLRAYLALPITLLLGADDIGTDNLSSEAEALAQGINRRERGRNTFAKAKAAAQAWRCRFAWRLAEVPGVGHDSAAMFASDQAFEALR
jgi:alpha-beta hydrolase superfamily lysophospholipase